jgi:hypothetical protein
VWRPVFTCRLDATPGDNAGVPENDDDELAAIDATERGVATVASDSRTRCAGRGGGKRKARGVVDVARG